MLSLEAANKLRLSLPKRQGRVHGRLWKLPSRLRLRQLFLWWLRRLERLRWRLLVLDRWSVGLVLLTSPAILVARLDHLLDERKDASRELVCELNGVLFAT